MGLKVEKLSKAFNGQTVIKDFNFGINPEEIVMLIGKSGTGKTTLMRLINQLEKADQGTISIDGYDLCRAGADGKAVYTSKKERNRYRNKIGMVFQDYQLFPHLTILENCIEAPLARKSFSRQEASEKADRLLQQMGIADKRGDYPDQLSGGQQQRAAIVRAMMLDPEILCFDEPTSALDRESAAAVGQSIQKITAQGTGILVVTHDLSFADSFGTRTISSSAFLQS